MALQSHKVFLQPSDPSERAWRYMDLAKFVALLLRKELHFTRLDCLEDRFEGTLPLQFRQSILEQMMRPLAVEQARPFVAKFLRFMDLLRTRKEASGAPTAREQSEGERKVIAVTLAVYLYVQLAGFLRTMAGVSIDSLAAAEALEKAQSGWHSALSQVAEKIDDPWIAAIRDVEASQEPMSTEELEQGIRGFVDYMVSWLSSMRKQLYVSCWHLGEWESEAMWRIYCGRGDGLAIALPYEQLRDSLTYPNTHIGKIEYVAYNLEQFQITDTFLSVALHKRREFGHEAEVRIVHLDLLSSDETRPEFLDVPWDVENAIEEVIISPYATPWYADMVKGMVERVAPKLLGKVKISSMAGPPAQ